MARNRWQSDESFEISQTPLIDIIFILIVFFLVATTFYTEERDLKVRLPEGTQGEAVVREAEKFVINVRQSGVYVVNNEIVTLDTLDKRLAELGKAGKRGPAVEIRGDADSRHASIMAIMNLCKKNQVSNYSLTQRIVQTVE